MLAPIKGKSPRDGLRPPLTVTARSVRRKIRLGRGDAARQSNKEMTDHDGLDTNRPIQVLGRILAVLDPLLEVRSPVLFRPSEQLLDRPHQGRWPKKLCAISRPIPQPNPCTTDCIRPAPCCGAKTAIAPTAKPARTIILTTTLLEIEAEETDRRGRRGRAVRRPNMFASPSPAAPAALSPRRAR